MNDTPEPASDRLPDAQTQIDEEPPRTVSSSELLCGRRELLILHEGEVYRLRLTRNSRLILQK